MALLAISSVVSPSVMMLVMTDSAGVGGRMSERGVRANVTAVRAICFAKITNGIDGNWDFGDNESP